MQQGEDLIHAFKNTDFSQIRRVSYSSCDYYQSSGLR